MKKIAFILLAVLICCLDSISQDIIILKSGDEILSKVEEIDKYTIKYRKHESLAGPLYTTEIKEVFMIIYENGTRELFNQEGSISNESDLTLGSSIVKKDFSNVSLDQIFSTEKKLVSSLEYLKSYAISYDGNYLGLYFLGVGKIYEYKLLRINDNRCTEIKLKGKITPFEYPNHYIGFSKDSKQFYTLTTNMEVYIWSTETGELLKKLIGLSTKAFSSDNKSRFTYVGNGVFNFDEASGLVTSDSFIIYGDKIYNFNGTVSVPFKTFASVKELNNFPSKTAVSQDNIYIATITGFAKKVIINDIKSGSIIANASGSGKNINSFTFTADNNLLISEKFSLNKYDLNSRTSQVLLSVEKYVYDMIVNRFNVLAFSETPSNSFQLWNLNKNESLINMSAPFKITYSLLFSHDGNKLFAISGHGEVICWNINYR